MTYEQITCVFHPNVIAGLNCERCRRPICLNDQRTYEKRRSRGSSRHRRTYYERYYYCPDCNINVLSNDMESAKSMGIIMSILMVLIALISGFSFLYIIPLIFIASYLSSKSKYENAVKMEHQNSGSPNTYNYRKETFRLNCNQCGSVIHSNQRFCNTCGDTTEDELRAHNNYM